MKWNNLRHPERLSERREWAALNDRGDMVHVWIDQDCCTGAGLCVDRCPDLFVVLEDGLGYIFDDDGAVTEPGRARPVPERFEDDAIDAAEHCPGECIYLEADPSSPVADDDDILDAEIVGP